MEKFGFEMNLIASAPSQDGQNFTDIFKLITLYRIKINLNLCYLVVFQGI